MSTSFITIKIVDADGALLQELQLSTASPAPMAIEVKNALMMRYPDMPEQSPRSFPEGTIYDESGFSAGFECGPKL